MQTTFGDGQGRRAQKLWCTIISDGNQYWFQISEMSPLPNTFKSMYSMFVCRFVFVYANPVNTCLGPDGTIKLKMLMSSVLLVHMLLLYFHNWLSLHIVWGKTQRIFLIFLGRDTNICDNFDWGVYPLKTSSFLTFDPFENCMVVFFSFSFLSFSLLFSLLLFSLPLLGNNFPPAPH